MYAFDHFGVDQAALGHDAFNANHLSEHPCREPARSNMLPTERAFEPDKKLAAISARERARCDTGLATTNHTSATNGPVAEIREQQRNRVHSIRLLLDRRASGVFSEPVRRNGEANYKNKMITNQKR